MPSIVNLENSCRMKRDFIINFILIFLALSVMLFTASAQMWFSASGALLLLLCVVHRQFTLFDRYKAMLAAERVAQRQASSESVDASAELLFYKALMDGVDTAVMLVTDNGHIEWMNRAARPLAGGGEQLPEAIMQALSARASELLIDGSEYSFSCSRVVMRNSARNIIALKNIHGAMEKSKVDAWHKLVRVLTHEIMNSMTPIISLSETLCTSVRNDSFSNDEDSVENIRRGLEIINRRSSGLLSFVENYRKLTRLAAPDKKMFSVASLVNDIKELFTQPFLIFDAASVANVELNADRAQIEQVLINILKNAIEACEEREPSEGYEKRVSFSVEKGADDNGAEYIAFLVRDNGVGIIAPVQEQIFVPFFTTKKQGSGIGLALCKQIVVNHGGSIELFSEENNGCTVVCRLPL